MTHNRHFGVSPKGVIVRTQTSQRAGAHPGTASLRKTMGSQRSSCSPGSRYSQSEKSDDDSWLISEGGEDPVHEKSRDVEVFRFLDLPDELRWLMYEYFLTIPPGEEFQLDQSLVDWSFSTVSASILKVSKDVYLEAFPVFLRQNRFLIGTSLTSPRIMRDFGLKRCEYLRSLSVHLNDRPVGDCIELLDTISLYCKDIRHLELRVSPGARILPYLTSILSARTQAGPSCRANVVFRLSIRNSDTVTTTEQTAAVRAAQEIRKSFESAFRWPLILGRAHEITIKGCINKSSLDALESFQYAGWHLEETSTVPVIDCNFREESVTRKWKESA